MKHTKKLLTSAIALGLAGALTLGGTFAWQSISQETLNESGDQVNPGGRLHNDLYYTDLNTTDSNVYVENFMDPEGKGSKDIFARVRLEEYMEVVLNYGTAGQQTQSVIGTREDTKDEEGNITSTKYNYQLFDFTDHVTKSDDGVYTVTAGLVKNGDTTDSNFTWTMGGEKTEDYYYMPTFNKNKDSLEADLNGMYVKRVGGIDKRSEEQYSGAAYTADSKDKTANAIYDIDSNLIDELKDLDITELNEIIDGTKTLDEAYNKSVQLKSEKHGVKKVGTSKGLISMADWLALNSGTYSAETHGNYWVYDTDGWVYWSSPIKAGESTGLLLDDFTLSQVMNHTWYYAINVVGQFVTADDTGAEDGSGFYDTSVGPVPSVQAQKLLRTIGATTSQITLVYDEAQLRSAVNEGGYITLMSDIDLKNGMLNTYKDMTIDLNGKTLSRHARNTDSTKFEAVIGVRSGALTMTGSGKLSGNGLNIRGIYTFDWGRLTVNGDAVYSGAVYAVAIRSRGLVTINGGIFTGNGNYNGTDYEVMVKNSRGSLRINGGYFVSAAVFNNNGRATYDTSKEIVPIQIDGKTFYTLQNKQPTPDVDIPDNGGDSGSSEDKTETADNTIASIKCANVSFPQDNPSDSIDPFMLGVSNMIKVYFYNAAGDEITDTDVIKTAMESATVKLETQDGVVLGESDATYEVNNDGILNMNIKKGVVNDIKMTLTVGGVSQNFTVKVNLEDNYIGISDVIHLSESGETLNDISPYDDLLLYVDGVGNAWLDNYDGQYLLTNHIAEVTYSGYIADAEEEFTNVGVDWDTTYGGIGKLGGSWTVCTEETVDERTAKISFDRGGTYVIKLILNDKTYTCTVTVVDD